MTNAGFQVAAASVAGWRHTSTGRPNQDAFHWAAMDDALVAVVCDGCGSGRHSELGAHFGARLTTRALLTGLAGGRARASRPDDTAAIQHLLAGTSRTVLHRLRAFADPLGDDLTLVVSDYLLFTVVGVAITHELAFAFGLGDGVISLNGRARVLGPFADNAPPYLGYGLFDSESGWTGVGSRQLELVDWADGGSFEYAAIATDGARALIAPTPEDRRVSDWCARTAADDRVFVNGDFLRRGLTQLGRDSTRIDWDERRVIRQRGVFDDDATILLVRRDPASAAAR